MKVLCSAVAMISLLSVGMATIPVSAQETKEEKVQVFDGKKIKEMSEKSKTTEMHSKLAEIVGIWDYTITLWATPDAEPDVSEGTVNNEMIYGERFLTSEANGRMSLGNHYDPYQGQGIMGYDKDQEVYTSVWIDTLSTGMQTGTGTYNDETKTIEFSGDYMSPSKQKKAGYRAELTFTGADSYTYTQYTLDQGNQEFKTMEIEYRRGK